MVNQEMPKKILLIEDDVGLAEFIQYQLQRDRYEVLIALRGEDGLRHAYQWQPDLILLDIMMPEMDGWVVCQRLREMSNVPIIFTTALGAERDVVRGLEMGADDYLIKPFGPKELGARIQAVLRRHAQNQPRGKTYHNARLSVNLEQREVRVDGQAIDLTPMEFKLLACLVKNEDKVVSHAYLLTQVWGQTYANERQYLKLYIWYLRQKLEADPARPQLIVTERGVGYRLARTRPAPGQAAQPSATPAAATGAEDNFKSVPDERSPGATATEEQTG
ncbi:MAG TPA: response regulator transcription factor [Anaerolineae bacterium]|nr:response regulator transcription factor [Anaerolineae bacterium]